MGTPVSLLCDEFMTETTPFITLIIFKLQQIRIEEANASIVAVFKEGCAWCNLGRGQRSHGNKP